VTLAPTLLKLTDNLALVDIVFLFGFKKLRRVSKRTEKAGLRF